MVNEEHRRWAVVGSVLVVVLAVTLAMTAPAVASSPSIGIDPASGPPLTTIRVSGLAYCPPPCGPVSIIIGTLTVQDAVGVDAAGTFTSYVRVPGTARAGTTAVIASQSDSHGGSLTSRTDFNVTPSHPPPTVYPPPSITQPLGAGAPPVTRSLQPVAPSASGPASTPEATPANAQPQATSTSLAAGATEPQAPTSDTASTTASIPSEATASSRHAADRSTHRKQVLVGLLVLVLVAAVISAVQWRRRSRKGA